MSGLSSSDQTKKDAERCLQLCVGAIGRWLDPERLRIDIPDIDPSLQSIRTMFVPVFVRRGEQIHSERRRLPHNEELSGYEVRPEYGQQIVEAIQTNRRAFDFVMDRISYNILKGFPLGGGLDFVASKRVIGLAAPAHNEGISTTHDRNVLFVVLAKRMIEFSGISKAPDELNDDNGKPRLCAANLIWAASSAFRLNIGPERVRKIIKENNKLERYADTHWSILSQSIRHAKGTANALAYADGAREFGFEAEYSAAYQSVSNILS